MRPTPKLTVGIPTLDRPDMLAEAIGSALAQEVECEVVVSDQGLGEGTARVMRRYKGHPRVRHLASPAKSSWENWLHVALSCRTDYFAWLQDDDLILPHFAARAIKALDSCPTASMYGGCLQASIADHTKQLPWSGVWPLVPMDTRRGRLQEVEGRLMAPAAYFATFSISPGLAFRNTHAFRVTMQNLPTGLDIYLERLYLAGMGLHGSIVCDPSVVGLIRNHADQEGRRLVTTPGEKDAQHARLVATLDGIVPHVPDWRELLRGWFACVAPAYGEAWLAETLALADSSPCLAEARAILETALRG